MSESGRAHESRVQRAAARRSLLNDERIDKERTEIAELLHQAKSIAKDCGLLYTVKYLTISELTAELEAGEMYYLREADEVADGSGESGN